MINISVIIPFLNEAEGMPALLQALQSFVFARPGKKFEFIFVDDGSTDNSVSLLTASKLSNCEAKVIKLSKNFGSHAALRAGIQEARGQYITFMYADLQDPLELIDAMHEKALEGTDLIWAHRDQLTGGLFERFFSGLYARMMRRWVNPNFPSMGFDVVMFSQRVQQVMNKNIEANSSIFLQLLTLGFSQQSIEYKKQSRKAGKSKWTLGKKIKLLIDSFVAFSFAPIRLVTVVGFSLFVIGLLFSAYLIFRKLFYNDLQQGWAMLISILMIGFGITNISLGIIAEYLWRTLDAARQRPVFIVEQIFDLSKQ